MTTKSFTIAAEHISPGELGISVHEELKSADKPDEEPPPKPSRVPSFKVKPKKPPQPSYHDRIYAEIDEGDEEENRDSTAQSPADDLKTPTEGSDVDMSKGGEVMVGSGTDTPRHSRLSEMYQPSGSDSGNGSGDSVQTSASDARKYVEWMMYRLFRIKDLSPLSLWLITTKYMKVKEIYIGYTVMLSFSTLYIHSYMY